MKMYSSIDHEILTSEGTCRSNRKTGVRLLISRTNVRRPNIINKSISKVNQWRCDLVDVESYVEEVDFVLLPAVFLQQLHQHRALFGFLLLFLCPLSLLWGHRLITVIFIIIVVLIIILIVR